MHNYLHKFITKFNLLFSNIYNYGNQSSLEKNKYWKNLYKENHFIWWRRNLKMIKNQKYFVCGITLLFLALIILPSANAELKNIQDSP